MRYFIDDIEVTEHVNAQFNIPDVNGGVYPNASTQWFDMLKIVNEVPALKATFFCQGGLHKFTMQSDNGQDFKAKILLRSHYSVRNC